MNTTTPLAEAVRYIRNTLAAEPRVSTTHGLYTDRNVDVVNIDTHYPPDPAVTTLILDLSDGTTIRLDITRYTR